MSFEPDRRHVLQLALAAGALRPAFAFAQETTVMSASDHRHDFDFLVGAWHVRHRTLKARLAGSSEWMAFDGTCVMQHLMNGHGNVDDNWLDRPGGAYRAVGLRAYDPATQLWAIWWLDGRTPHNSVEPPVRGNFENGVGTFFADDTLGGKPIKIRFMWSEIAQNTARWQQAFSPDGGTTWETNWDMHFTRELETYELRQYDMVPGRRDNMVALFDREFADQQEQTGSTIIGQFRDVDNANRFVWLRAHQNMPTRATAMHAFYDGPQWAAHKGEANANIADSGNVLLLRPAWPGAGFANSATRAPQGSTKPQPGIVTANICYFADVPDEAFLTTFRNDVQDAFAKSGVKVIAALTTEPAPNNFPRHPIREGEHVFIWFSLFETERAVRTPQLPAPLTAQLTKPIETIRLSPTPRSRLHA